MDLVFDIRQLENLRTLHEHEEELRAQSLELLAANAKCSEMLFLIANAMGVLFGFSHDHKAQNDDELTIQYFGIRLFNTAGASIKLALGGYAQQALAHTRDIMEVSFLLDYFRTNPAEIRAWKLSDTKTRKNKYGPLQIRIALDARDGNKERKREKAYAKVSEFASHASYSGFVLTMKNGDGMVGPFVDDIKLRAWLQELSLRLLPAADLFGRHFPNGSAEPLAFYRSFSNQVIEWWNLRKQRPEAMEGDIVEPAGK